MIELCPKGNLGFLSASIRFWQPRIDRKEKDSWYPTLLAPWGLQEVSIWLRGFLQCVSWQTIGRRIFFSLVSTRCPWGCKRLWPSKPICSIAPLSVVPVVLLWIGIWKSNNLFCSRSFYTATSSLWSSMHWVWVHTLDIWSLHWLVL